MGSEADIQCVAPASALVSADCERGFGKGLEDAERERGGETAREGER